MPGPLLDETQQREVTRVCVETGLLVLRNGAESALVETTARRMGLALGATSVEVAIAAHAITVTTLSNGRSITTVRRNVDFGIDMHVVTETTRTLLAVEAGELDLEGAARRLEAIRPFRYPRLLVVLLVGLSCASFARLRGADLAGCAVTLVAASVAMALRQELGRRHFKPLVNFFATAFVATSISAQALIHELGESPKIAMASSVLLLVPGMPLINAVSDIVKGYVDTGIARWSIATALTFATAGGIVLAMDLWDAWAGP